MASGHGSITRWLGPLQAGDALAAQQLWQRYFHRLVGLARQKLHGAPRRKADEEDVALSAFDSFVRAAEQGRFPDLADRDGLWRLLMVITARKAAHLRRTEWLFNLGAEHLFADPRIRVPEAREAMKEIVLPEPARLGRFRKHLIAVAQLNHETWKHIRAEQDNDHEWLPNARQQGVRGLPVREDMVDAWLAMMTELQALLEGKRTLPAQMWGKQGKRLNLKALLDDPPKGVELKLRFPDDLPEKYLSDAQEVGPGVLQRVIEVLSAPAVGANPLSYALYFN